MIDVILPCLDEAGALPSVLAGLPPGYRALVVDNGSTDGSADIARGLGATIVREQRRGFGAACAAGLAAAEADVVCFCDCDGSLDLAELPLVADPVVGGTAQLMLGRRRPVTRRAMAVSARIANRSLSRQIRAATGLSLNDLGPMRAARRVDLLNLDVQDRRSGWPLEMVLRAASRGWRIGEVPVRICTTDRALQGHRDRAGHVHRHPRHARSIPGSRSNRSGGSPMNGRIHTRIVVLAKAPVAGRSKTRLTPPYQPDQAAAIARACLQDTLETICSLTARDPRFDTLVCLDGEPGSWLPAGVPFVSQCEGGHDVRIGQAMEDAVQPAGMPPADAVVVVGMDTPQITTGLLARASRLASTTDAVLGPALDGGWWLLGLRARDARRARELVTGVPMSTSDTGRLQRQRLRQHALSVDTAAHPARHRQRGGYRRGFGRPARISAVRSVRDTDRRLPRRGRRMSLLLWNEALGDLQHGPRTDQTNPAVEA